VIADPACSARSIAGLVRAPFFDQRRPHRTSDRPTIDRRDRRTIAAATTVPRLS
jgi:hypothetical protein